MTDQLQTAFAQIDTANAADPKGAAALLDLLDGAEARAAMRANYLHPS